jgi:RHS repeat-associated protein
LTGTVTTAYSANSSGATTTVTDEAGNSHINTVDGLGRLTSVQEPAGATTTYAYDGLNNLTSVTQPGQIYCPTSSPTYSRCFAYDSLARLQSAQNPESGTVSYTYYANGNLKTKTDARSVTETLNYDGLNRVLSKTYSDGTTPTVNYTYDYGWTAAATCTNCDTKGTLYQVSNGNSSTVYTHDPLGRVVTSTQTTASVTYPAFGYTYSLSDQLASMTYPSGRTVSYGFDSANRILTVTGAFRTQTTHYTAAGQNVAYTAAGGFSSVPLGNGITESYGWNDRLQQTSIAAGNLLGLSFYPCDGGLTACTNNTGNIWRETISIGGTVQATQEYRYDALNRLTLADERAGAAGFTPACQDGSGVWAEQYSYDTFGNRAVPCQSSNLSGLTWEVTSVSSYNTSTNRITGWGYDAAGSINATPAGQSITYDAENHQTQYCGAGSSGCEQYVYDGDGRRVQKTGPTGTVTYVYDAGGNLAAEYGGTAAASGTQYLTADHLGSTRLVTNASGAVTERHDYVPFGYELSGGWRTAALGYGPETVRQQFTGKERDAETGLDYFGARYFSGAQGRFTSADPKVISGQKLSDPQQWNMYSYTRNNPLQFVDPDGKELRLAQGADASKLIPVLAHAYTKAEFRTKFDALAASKNVHLVNNVGIKQDPAKENLGIVEEGHNLPKPADPSQPISNTNLVNTIELDNTFVLGPHVTPEGQDFVVGHEFDHGVKIDSDPAGQIAQHNDPTGAKAQEDAANKAGNEIAGQKPSMSTEKATQAVEKALGCSTDSAGKTTCK